MNKEELKQVMIDHLNNMDITTDKIELVESEGKITGKFYFEMECISAGGKGYDIDKDFNSWLKNYIKEKLGIKDE
ncbi:hypothetical protein ABGT15_04460 [Flavobacterium enshiense]|uniref:hypothetical protein n=1 Tax=Flavobacterium enshiense TaxID=1341165 RepID=UPI00345D0520